MLAPLHLHEKGCIVFCTCSGGLRLGSLCMLHPGVCHQGNVLGLMMSFKLQHASESITWYCGRWMLVGAYVGFATVGAFCVWYMFDSFLGLDLSGDGHSTVTFNQLRNWEQCRTWPDFKVRPCIAQGRISDARFFTTVK